MSKQNILVYVLGSCCLILSLAAFLYSFGVLERIGPQDDRKKTAKPQTVSLDFQTPEATIEFFVEALNQSNAKEMLQAFSIEEEATRRDFVGTGKWAGRFDPRVFLPPQYDEYKQFNKHYLAYQAMGAIASLRFELILSDEYRAQLYGFKMSENIVSNELVKRMDPRNMPQLEIVKISKSDFLSDARVQRNAKERAVLNGAANFTERAALIEAEGKLYAVGFELYCYNGKWLISRLQAGYAGFSPPIEPIDSKTDFDNRLKRNKR